VADGGCGHPPGHQRGQAALSLGSHSDDVDRRRRGSVPRRLRQRRKRTDRRNTSLSGEHSSFVHVRPEFGQSQPIETDGERDERAGENNQRPKNFGGIARHHRAGDEAPARARDNRLQRLQAGHDTEAAKAEREGAVDQREVRAGVEERLPLQIVHGAESHDGEKGQVSGGGSRERLWFRRGKFQSGERARNG
jgi:hypothetical protein